jgi:hypothetical protein
MLLQTIDGDFVNEKHVQRFQKRAGRWYAVMADGSEHALTKPVRHFASMPCGEFVSVTRR